MGELEIRTGVEQLAGMKVALNSPISTFLYDVIDRACIPRRK